MNAIDVCPKCKSYLNYDGDSNEWYCSGDCDYVESEKITLKIKVRKREITE